MKEGAFPWVYERFISNDNTQKTEYGKTHIPVQRREAADASGCPIEKKWGRVYYLCPVCKKVGFYNVRDAKNHCRKKVPEYCRGGHNEELE